MPQVAFLPFSVVKKGIFQYFSLYTDDKTAVLFACDMDLKRIRNLKIGAEPKSLNLIVICLDFQAELLSQYYGNLATIRTIDSRKTAELFKIPYGGGAS